MVKIAVIGSAGRQKVKLTFDQYNKMYNWLKKYLSLYKKDEIELISGGAAWSDHLSVRAYLDGFVGKLSLYLPCKWDFEKDQYMEKNNEGIMSNLYHKNFYKETGIKSCEELTLCMLSGATIDDASNGYFERNRKVAKECDKLIAFTMSSSEYPAKGGTLYTWTCAANKERIHVSIGSL